MDFKKLDTLKGFMPSHEGQALTKWAKKFSQHGPAPVSYTHLTLPTKA